MEGGEKQKMTAYIKKVSKLNFGFTLIELLIVIAILGVLAIVVLAAIDPIQQLARTRDSGRKSTVTQIGHAVQAYYTSRNATYPTESTTWISTLTTAGELATLPSQVNYGVGGITSCGTNAQNQWCYDTLTTSTGAVIYTILESTVERSKCTSGQAYFMYDAEEGRGGIVCSSSDPTSATTWNSVQ